MQSKTSQKIGITGGAGLIGSELASILVNSGAEVVIIDDFSKGRMCNIEKFIDKIEVRKGNLEEKTFASSAFDDLDIVYHLKQKEPMVLDMVKGTTWKLLHITKK